MKKIAITVAMIALAAALRAEIVYLKDGQVLRGEIVNEGKETVTVRTSYQTRVIYRTHILRIMYGDREMEPVYFLLRDGNMVNGFLVDQDSQKVVYRKSKDSAEEFTVLKTDISQMSGKEIVPLNPDLSVRGGIYYPINPGGSELSRAPMVFVGYGINFTWVRNARLLLEAGYVKCGGSANEDLGFQITPLLASGLYTFPFPFVDQSLSSTLKLVPKAGAGLAVVDFNDGEGGEYRGYDFTALAGAGVVYEISRRKLSAGLWLEYSLIYEKSAMMHAAIVSGGLHYVF